jgi:NAD+ kinase
MKVAIYGQYYQNSTEPIIRDILFFFNKKQQVIEASTTKLLYEKKDCTKKNTKPSLP